MTRRAIGVSERPPLLQTIPLSLQHLFAMFGATVLVPILFHINPATVLLFTEAFGADVVLAHQAQLVFDEWVFDFHNLHSLSPLRGSHKKNRGIIPLFADCAIPILLDVYQAK